MGTIDENLAPVPVRRLFDHDLSVENRAFAFLLGIGLLDCAVNWLLALRLDAPRNYSFTLIASFVGLPIACIATWVPIAAVIRRHPEPTRHIASVYRKHASWATRAVVLMVLVALSASTFTYAKNAIPTLVPFYADPFIADFELGILGSNPIDILHAILGPFGLRAIDLVYAMWVPGLYAFVVWLCLTPNRHLQVVAGISWFACWLILGCLIAFAGSSVGPCFFDHFYGDKRFAGSIAYVAAHAPLARSAMHYLASKGDAIGSGISAFPSLHVSIATLEALVVSAGTSKWLWRSLAWAFAASIYVGSVALGWHYVSDGLVSLAMTILIWKGAQHVCDKSARRQRDSRLGETAPKGDDI